MFCTCWNGCKLQPVKYFNVFGCWFLKKKMTILRYLTRHHSSIFKGHILFAAFHCLMACNFKHPNGNKFQLLKIRIALHSTNQPRTSHRTNPLQRARQKLETPLFVLVYSVTSATARGMNRICYMLSWVQLYVLKFDTPPSKFAFCTF